MADSLWYKLTQGIGFAAIIQAAKRTSGQMGPSSPTARLQDCEQKRNLKPECRLFIATGFSNRRGEMLCPEHTYRTLTNWRASKASETLSGLFNRESRILSVSEASHSLGC